MKLKLMPDYDCWPIWRDDAVSDGVAYNVDPVSLPITKALCDRLVAWAEEYDGTLNRMDPASSGFGSREAEYAHEREGRKLAQHLQREFGSESTVRFWLDDSNQERSSGRW